jgi:hypothetical protein
MKPRIWVFSLEPLESRYTAQWYDHVPQLLQQATDQYEVRQVAGQQSVKRVTAGAFLNFVDTNRWKSTQLAEFLNQFDAGQTTPHDRFLFTDFWNPVITQIRYISDLMGFHWQIHAIAHAGAYDPSDILGYKMTQPWPTHQERSWLYQCDSIYFATEFHRQMFLKNLDIPWADHGRAVLSGQPYEMLAPMLRPRQEQQRSVDVIWPHRYNADKQPQIAELLNEHLTVAITQKLNLSKSDYYDRLGQSRVVFSCALHENLGISVSEGCLAGAIPVVPDRCSYSEMYLPQFKYPSHWTSSVDNYRRHATELVEFIREKINNYDGYHSLLKQQQQRLVDNYLDSSVMMKRIVGQSDTDK